MLVGFSFNFPFPPPRKSSEFAVDLIPFLGQVGP